MALVFELVHVDRFVCLSVETLRRLSCRKCDMRPGRWQDGNIFMGSGVSHVNCNVVFFFLLKISVLAKMAEGKLFQCLEIYFVLKKSSCK